MTDKTQTVGPEGLATTIAGLASQVGSTEKIAVLRADHLAQLIEANERWMDERDRRYSEVAIEREKAMAIKTVADERALALAREIQTYKDEKANELREQINRERVLYTTRDDLRALAERVDVAIKPLSEFVAAQQGAKQGQVDQRTVFFAVGGLLLVVLGLAMRAWGV